MLVYGKIAGKQVFKMAKQGTIDSQA